MSISELDSTVRTFYEGRGEAVSLGSCCTVVSLWTNVCLMIASTSPDYAEPGETPRHSSLTSGRDAQSITVQGESRFMAAGGQNTAGCDLSADQMYDQTGCDT